MSHLSTLDRERSSMSDAEWLRTIAEGKWQGEQYGAETKAILRWAADGLERLEAELAAAKPEKPCTDGRSRGRLRQENTRLRGELDKSIAELERAREQIHHLIMSINAGKEP